MSSIFKFLTLPIIDKFCSQNELSKLSKFIFKIAWETKPAINAKRQKIALVFLEITKRLLKNNRIKIDMLKKDKSKWENIIPVIMARALKKLIGKLKILYL